MARYEHSKTKHEYLKRINHVMGYIENNLDKDLDLEGLSNKAFYSSFHFHRIFSTIVGETLHAFIVRKRIERIASILAVGTTESYVDLAYAYGFNSASSFSRAFKKYYGISPTEYKEKGIRENNKNGIASIDSPNYICGIDSLITWMKMNAHIEVLDLPAITLAGIMHLGKPEQINQTYERLFKWVTSKEAEMLPDCKVVTLYHDNPKITESSKIRQSACVTVRENCLVDGDVVKMDIQKGRFVVGHFVISPDQFQKAWDSLCVWVLENGYAFRDGDFFEVYRNDYRKHPERKFIVDLCVPIKSGKSETSHNVVSSRIYSGAFGFMKGLRSYLIRNYPVGYTIGSLYSNDTSITYFPFTPIELKEQKLKIAIVYNHTDNRFEVWLAGQNKTIQKKYWTLFKESDWNTYHIPVSVEKGFSIVESVLVEHPDFNDATDLIEQIEAGVVAFIREMDNVLA